MKRCSKCSIDSKGLITISVGTEDLYVKTEMLVCWKCFRKEFNKHENKNIFVFKREQPKVNVKKTDLNTKEKNKKVEAEVKVNVEKEIKAEKIKAEKIKAEKKSKAEKNEKKLKVKKTEKHPKSEKSVKKAKAEKKFKMGKKVKDKKPEAIVEPSVN